MMTFSLPLEVVQNSVLYSQSFSPFVSRVSLPESWNNPSTPANIRPNSLIHRFSDWVSYSSLPKPLISFHIAALSVARFSNSAWYFPQSLQPLKLIQFTAKFRFPIFLAAWFDTNLYISPNRHTHPLTSGQTSVSIWLD